MIDKLDEDYLESVDTLDEAINKSVDTLDEALISQDSLVQSTTYVSLSDSLTSTSSTVSPTDCSPMSLVPRNTPCPQELSPVPELPHRLPLYPGMVPCPRNGLLPRNRLADCSLCPGTSPLYPGTVS